MEKYIIAPTPNAPSINFDLENGVLEIKGCSRPQNAEQFYTPFIQALNEYSRNPQPKTIVNLTFEVIDVSSAKPILEVFTILDSINKHSEVTITWYYDEEDAEDMLETIAGYQDIIEVEIHTVQIKP